MIPPKTKSIIMATVEKYVSELKRFKNSNPVIMLGELKLDRIDQKIKKEAEKLNARQINKDVKIEGKSRKYEKRQAAITYRSYTVEFKRKLINKIKEINEKSNIGLSKIIRAKARQLNIHPKNIFRWFHTKEIKKKQGGRKALYPEMEERLAQFIISNPKMKRKHILRQAKQIMEDLQIPGREYFNFSKGWYERFRQRLVRKKILPGKIEAKNEFDEDSDSDFDESECSIKKQEEFIKTQNDDPNLKIQYQSDQDQSDFSDDNDDDEQKKQTKLESSGPGLKIKFDEFALPFDHKIFVPKGKDSTKQELKCQKSEKQEAKKEEDNCEVKTNESGEYDYQDSRLDSSSNQSKVSIFASDEEKCTKE